METSCSLAQLSPDKNKNRKERQCGRPFRARLLQLKSLVLVRFTFSWCEAKWKTQIWKTQISHGVNQDCLGVGQSFCKKHRLHFYEMIGIGFQDVLLRIKVPSKGNMPNSSYLQYEKQGNNVYVCVYKICTHYIDIICTHKNIHRYRQIKTDKHMYLVFSTGKEG